MARHKKIKPQFYFGHGLSYTNFKIADIITDKNEYLGGETMKISCNVSNIGHFDGAEVVQVYIGKVKSNVERAVKELKGFKKVILVKKGASVVTDISINTNSLSYFDETISDWSLEKGMYIIYVGTASDKIVKEIKITIK
ncbi:MAG: hypothetical protein HC831_10375 [Chloroflexia bacterium]|nr:hypothetical protein [Chloroflexia bacterium]